MASIRKRGNSYLLVVSMGIHARRTAALLTVGGQHDILGFINRILRGRRYEKIMLAYCRYRSCDSLSLRNRGSKQRTDNKAGDGTYARALAYIDPCRE